MVKSRLPGINRVRKRLADGTIRTYFYHRETGTRLTGSPDTVEFAASFAEAGRASLRRHEAGLIRDFLDSAEFEQQLAETTQREYRRLLTQIDHKFGSVPISVIADSRFESDALAWRDEIATTRPRESDNRMVIFARLLSWAKRRHLISANPLADYTRIHRADRSELIWLPEQIKAFQEVASPEIWAVFLVALHTGLRQGDIRRLSWSAFDGRAITWRISKRHRGSAGVRVTIPCTKALTALLDGLSRRGPLILTTSSGRAWQKRYLAHQFEIARSAAEHRAPEVGRLHFHDLRGTAITLLAEAGASVPEIAAITGHSYRSITSILERYLPRTRHLSEMAISKLENSGRTDIANRLQTEHHANLKGEAK